LSAGLDQVLGPPYAALAERLEADFRDHAAELNERRRNLLTVRGFGITSVSALLTATVVSDQALLAAFAVIVVAALVYVDLDSHRRIQVIEKQFPFLEETSRRVHRALALGSTTGPIAGTVPSRLRTYKGSPSGTKELDWGIRVQSPLSWWRPFVRPPFRHEQGALRFGRALGPFVWLYTVLALGCCVIGVGVFSDDPRVTAVVGCLAPAGTDVRAAVVDGRCRALSPAVKRSSCRVPTRLVASMLTVRCKGVRGRVLIAVSHGEAPVVSRRAIVSNDGRVALDVGVLRRGWTYRVTITRGGQVLAGAQPMRNA
jgi:hypothetical protein